MNFEAGICPKCHEYLLLKTKTPFLVCPKCGETISAQSANAIVERRCANIENVNSIVGECVALEIKYGPELPYMLLAKVVSNFPHLESPSYLLVKLSGFQVGLVYDYLKTFASIKSDPANVAWAESFLDNTLDFKTIEYADLYRSYVRNKVRPERQQHYFDLIDQLVKDFTTKSSDPRSTKMLMSLYVIASILNFMLFPVMMFLSGWLSQVFSLYYIVNILLAVVAVCVEMLLLVWHHKVFGNRLSMSQKERLWMVIFLSSMVFVVGAVVMGSIWKIKL